MKRRAGRCPRAAPVMMHHRSAVIGRAPGGDGLRRAQTILRVECNAGAGRAVLRRNLRRRELPPFFETRAPVEVALESVRRLAPMGSRAGGAWALRARWLSKGGKADELPHRL